MHWKLATIIQLDQSRYKNKVQGLKNQNSPLFLWSFWGEGRAYLSPLQPPDPNLMPL